MRLLLRALFTFICTFCLSSVWAQCTLSWQESRFSKPNIKGSFLQEKLTDNSYVVGLDGYKVPKSFLDSAIQYFKKPYWYLDRFGVSGDVDDSTVKALTDSMKVWGDVYHESAKFKYQGKQIVHYRTDTFKVDEEMIYVHRFEYCEKEWNEDYSKNEFRYTKQFGIIEKGYLSFDPLECHLYFLNNNSCLGKKDNEKMEKLVSKIRGK